MKRRNTLGIVAHIAQLVCRLHAEFTRQDGLWLRGTDLYRDDQSREPDRRDPRLPDRKTPSEVEEHPREDECIEPATEELRGGRANNGQCHDRQCRSGREHAGTCPLGQPPDDHAEGKQQSRKHVGPVVRDLKSVAVP